MPHVVWFTATLTWQIMADETFPTRIGKSKEYLECLLDELLLIDRTIYPPAPDEDQERNWKRLRDYSQQLQRGNLIRCVLDGTPVVLLLRDDNTMIPLTRPNAGTTMFWVESGADVLMRPNGQCISNMDLRLGGNIVDRWNEAVPPP